MRVLITGATGFIGRAVSESLARAGHELIVLTRDVQNARSTIPAPHKALLWDFSEAEIQDPRHLLDAIDAVIHLAGEPIFGKRWNAQVEKTLYDSRVKTTERLAQILSAHCKVAPKVFISSSAIGFYGDRGDDLLDETSTPGSDFLATICRDWETALFTSPLDHTRKIALRTGIVLGRSGGALAEMLGVFSLGLGGRLGDGKQWMSWIHLDDWVKVLLECLHNDQVSGPVNCCSPHPVTNLEFTQILAAQLSTSARLPAPKVALLASLGKGASALCSSQRIRPAALEQLGFEFQYPQLNKALSEILSENYSRGYSEFQRKCYIPRPVSEVFSFFSSASNLERITPPWLHFHILNQTPDTMERGTTIDYQLKIHGLPARWKTEISRWNPPFDFTDIQLKGPYKVWQHTHRFSELGTGTVMEDRIGYKLPVGKLGKIVAGQFIAKDISTIFNHRTQKIFELLAPPEKEVS